MNDVTRLLEVARPPEEAVIRSSNLISDVEFVLARAGPFAMLMRGSLRG
jgi:hypothetical protein